MSKLKDIFWSLFLFIVAIVSFGISLIGGTKFK
jgi:hypothetical protein